MQPKIPGAMRLCAFPYKKPFLLNSLSSNCIIAAAEITEEGISFISGKVGLGNLTCCSPLRFPTGFLEITD